MIRDTSLTVFENCTFVNNSAISSKPCRSEVSAEECRALNIMAIEPIGDQNTFRGGALYVDNVRRGGNAIEPDREVGGEDVKDTENGASSKTSGSRGSISEASQDKQKTPF